MLTKICTKCGVEKGVDHYHKDKKAKYGVRTDCKLCSSHHKFQYYQANKATKLKQVSAYYKANKESVSKRMSAYAKANRHIHNAIGAKRRATKLQATPAWADLEAIQCIYLLASINREGGHDLHVDHIVPLQSDIVCGLHCEANLQLMSASDNISKGNRHWPDMP